VRVVLPVYCTQKTIPVNELHI